MSRRTNRSLAAGSALVLGFAAVSLVAAPGSSATTGTQMEKVVLDSEYILLDTADDQVRSTASTATQSIVEGCSLGSDELLSPADALLSIRPGPTVANGPEDQLGYGKNGIGVAGKQDKSGTRCADVDADYNQSLVVDVTAGTALAANLDLELKFGALVTIEAFSGEDANGNPTPVALTSPDVSATVENGVVTFDESTLNDDGPDSRDGDNYRIQVEAVGGGFTSLKLTAAAGSFALEGGGDGTRPTSANELLPGETASVFEVVIGDGLLRCDKVDEDGETEDFVTLIFTDCLAGSVVPYLIDRERDENDNLTDIVRIGVPESSENAYKVIIEWQPDAAQFPVPRPEVAFFDETGDGLTDDDFQQLDWCSFSDTGAFLAEDSDDRFNEGQEPYGAPGAQGACVESQLAEAGPEPVPTVDDDLITVTDTILLFGDPFFTSK